MYILRVSMPFKSWWNGDNWRSCTASRIWKLYVFVVTILKLKRIKPFHIKLYFFKLIFSVHLGWNPGYYYEFGRQNDHYGLCLTIIFFTVKKLILYICKAIITMVVVCKMTLVMAEIVVVIKHPKVTALNWGFKHD